MLPVARDSRVLGKEKYVALSDDEQPLVNELLDGLHRIIRDEA